MVLDDGLLSQLDASRFERVMAPKAMGAFYLHEHTRHLPLEHFVLFSSIASVWEAPGQGNYAAANSILDALAHYRRGQGLPALSVNWGALNGVGYVAGHADIARYLERQGIYGLAPHEALELLGLLMARRSTQGVAVRMNWPMWGRLHPAAYARARYAPVMSTPATAREEVAPAIMKRSVRDELLLLSGEDRLALLRSRLAEHVIAVLEVPGEKLDTELPLVSYGLDSLIGVEIKSRIEADVGFEVPVTTLLRGPSITQLATMIAERLKDTGPGTVTERGEPSQPLPTAANVVRPLPERSNGPTSRVRVDAHASTRGRVVTDPRRLFRDTSLRAGGVGLSAGLRLLHRTCRFELASALPELEGGSLICLWHEHFVAYAAWLSGGHGRYAALFHPSPAMDPWAKVASAKGWKVIRGSSGHHGGDAAEALIPLLREGYCGVVHPDGPGGPSRVLKWGVLHVARKADVPIIPLRIRYENAVRLPGWDRKQIPLPYSKVHIDHDLPIDTHEEGLEASYRRLSAALG